MSLPRYILAFYLILLSVIPCCAFDSCPDDKAATEQAGNHENGDEDHCGNCSPFFNCEGCASVTINGESTYYTQPLPAAKRVYADFIFPFIPDMHYGFWQPPRAG